MLVFIIYLLCVFRSNIQ